LKRSASGERLWREMRVRVCIPGMKDIVWRSHPPARRGYSAADLDKMLDQVAEHLEKRFPSIEFRMVELAPNMFNFIYEGKKEMSEAPKNPCPDSAVASAIAARVCAEHGHSIAAMPGGMRITPQGPVQDSITVCTKCGLGLNEIREGTDRAFNMAVSSGVQQAIVEHQAKQIAAGQAGGKPQAIELPVKDAGPVPV